MSATHRASNPEPYPERVDGGWEIHDQKAEQTKHLQLQITRAKFEQIVDELVQRTVKPTEQALKDSGLTKDKIDEVLLVGGMTRMPKV